MKLREALEAEEKVAEVLAPAVKDFIRKRVSRIMSKHPMRLSAVFRFVAEKLKYA